MNYLNSIGVEQITGKTGQYDGKINNDSVKYARNAGSNYNSYVESIKVKPLTKDMLDFSNVKNMSNEEFENKLKAIDDSFTDSQIKFKFNYKYMPEEKVDPNNLNKMALLGAAFEELGKKASVSVSELTANLQKLFGSNVSAEALDVNKDNQIDIGEYSSSILLNDMLSSESGEIDPQSITGNINNKGQIASFAYLNTNDKEIGAKIHKTIYDFFGLNQAAQEFSADANNIV